MLSSANAPMQVLWTITDAIEPENETAIWFYTRYISLTDLNNDGYIDPIVPYGTASKYDEPYQENRLKLILYYLTSVRYIQY